MTVVNGREGELGGWWWGGSLIWLPAWERERRLTGLSSSRGVRVEDVGKRKGRRQSLGDSATPNKAWRGSVRQAKSQEMAPERNWRQLRNLESLNYRFLRNGGNQPNGSWAKCLALLEPDVWPHTVPLAPWCLLICFPAKTLQCVFLNRTNESLLNICL